MEFGKSKKTTEIKPLQGIKIVELSTVVTAALATKLLTEQGAENVKAEPVGIGDARRYPGTSRVGRHGVDLSGGIDHRQGRSAMKELACRTLSVSFVPV